MKTTRIFTIGHSDRTLDEFLALLEHSAIRLVADVRSNPVSVRFPWFERYTLSEALERNGFSYRWFRQLGARVKRQPGAAQQTGIDEDLRDYAAYLSTPRATNACRELVEIGSSCNMAILCAERDVARCHRRLIADVLCHQGARVVHIIGTQQAEDHVINPGFGVLESGEFVYRQDQLSLFSAKS